MFRHVNTLKEFDEVIMHKYGLLGLTSENQTNRKNHVFNMLNDMGVIAG
jgi:hypothetical protein